MKKLLILALVSLLGSSLASAANYLIINYGAVGDGRHLNTAAIQQAIDQCSLKGGGRVVVPAGDFVTGSIFLKSHVELYLEAGAKLSGSTNRIDYPKMLGERGLIFALNMSDVSITGHGEINGNGKAFFAGDNAPDRPFLILIKKSARVNVSGISLKNSAFWTFRLLYCDQVTVSGINIYSHVNFNNDGLDIDSKNVTVSNCIIDTDDDALCFKSDSSFICQNVVVNNCVLASNCNLIKMGTASVGGFKNISISNCVLRRASESNFRFWERKVPGVTESCTSIAGIALEVVDGGTMDGITISNIVMDGVQTPLFMRLGSRNNPTGSLKNVIISGISAKSASRVASSITAVPGFYVEHVVLRDIQIQSPGGGTQNDYRRAVPEQEKAYPENRMFNTALPAYGLYLRHAKDIALYNVNFDPAVTEARTAIYIEDGHDVRITDLKAASPTGSAPLVELNQVQGFMLSCSATHQLIPLLCRIRGNRSARISTNYSSGAKRLYELKDGASPGAIISR